MILIIIHFELLIIIIIYFMFYSVDDLFLIDVIDFNESN